ncbi:hypothetical protein ILUMI_08314 [Ignelater luminosus]|uniref:Annexin n=1 Tax=Ignelater luminosus TaxID=2038154 RepID=A0A8K0D1W0_IGNLU|nr:hypothetical protein ILUMI_08314 [Ignelater luminosus]
MKLQVFLGFCCIFLLQNNHGATGQTYPYGGGGGIKTQSSGVKTNLGFGAQRYNPNYNQNYNPNYNPNLNSRSTVYGRSDTREVYNLRAEDVRTLRNALEAPEPDAKAIIHVLAHRSNLERVDIANLYENIHKQPLVKDLGSKLTGWFKELIIALMMQPTQFYVKQLYDAVNGAGTDEDALIDILCSLNNDEIRRIRKLYEHVYGGTLESHIRQDTSGDFRNLMIALVGAERDETDFVDISQARVNAQKLLDAGKLKWGTDEPIFLSILTQTNYKQLRQISIEYEKLAGHTLESAITDEFSGTLRQGLLGILRIAQGLPVFFAERLHASMEGSGTNNKQLIRLVVSRSEIDIDLIKAYYKTAYKISLEDAIIDDTSGDFKECLLAIVGGNLFQQTLKF